MADSRSLRSLRRLVRKAPGDHEMDKVFFDLMDDSSDRAVAIIAAAIVENALERVVIRELGEISEEHKKELFEGDGPLVTFSAKIRMASALRILGPSTRKEMDAIRAIRNTFAHAILDIKFSTDEVSAACNRLSPVNFDYWPPKLPPATPRIRYLFGCVFFYGALSEIAVAGGNNFSRRRLRR